MLWVLIGQSVERDKTSSSHVPLDGLFSCMYCDHQFGIRKYFGAHMMIHQDKDNSNLDIKCSDCVLKCTKEVTMKKHLKSDKNIILENSKENIKNNNEKEDKEYLEDDYFQIEIVNGETVYACTICDEGLDSVEEVRNHVKDEHREVIVM